MRLGSLGILSKQIFKEHNPASYKVDASCVFLTTAIDVTEKYKNYYPKLSNTIFELKWHFFDSKQDEIITAVFLSNMTTPDRIIATGGDFKSYTLEINKWKYYKVLLTQKNKSKTVFLHEKSIELFDWINKEKIDSHEFF